jgi:hypothetical protein
MNGLDYKDWTDITVGSSAIDLLDWIICLITVAVISYHNDNIFFCYYTLFGQSFIGDWFYPYLQVQKSISTLWILFDKAGPNYWTL